MTRRGWLLAGVGVCVALLLSLMFAVPRWSAPFVAAERFDLANDAWQTPGGRSSVEDGALRVEIDGGTAVATRADLQLSAAPYRYLHYAIGNVAADARALLLWRSGGETTRRILPRAFDAGVIDLAALPGWEGEIDSVAIIVGPVDYLSDAAVTSQAFVLSRAQLRSDNWWSAFAATWLDWLAPRPWSGSSINSAGGEFGKYGASLTAFVAVWLLLMLVLVRVATDADALRRAVPVLLVAACAVLVLDGGRDLLARTRSAHAADARVQAQPMLPLAADPGLGADAAQLAAVLPARDASRVLVHSAVTFQRDYSVYLLREHDVSAVADAIDLAALPAAILVLARGDDWAFDAATGQLRVGTQTRAATSLWEGPRLSAFRLEMPVVTP